MAPLLELHGVSKSFGGLRVIQNLDLMVEEGEIVSLIGPNGAGKTTVFNLVTGVYSPDEGTIRLAGEDIVGVPPHRIATMGAARTSQSIRLFLNMSVRENVMVGGYGRTQTRPWQAVLRTRGARAEESEEQRLAEELLSFFGKRLVGFRLEQPAYSLSYANRRRLEIARALALKPRVLFLDEPTAGMNPTETAEMLEIIRTLKGRFTILLIEHKLDLVMQLSDRVVVMDDGERIAEGLPREVASDPAVIAAYLGSREVGASKERAL